MTAPVPVVRLIVTDAKGRVLLLERAATRHALGAWCLPGGKVDYCETVASAASKEHREETSLDCVRLRFLVYQDSLPAEPGMMHCINLYFECEASGEIALNEESTSHRWVSASEMASINVAFGNDDALRRYWRERGEDRG